MHLLTKYAHIITIILICTWHRGNAEFYSSTSSLVQLLNTELVLLEELQSYVNEITQHAEALQSEIDVIHAEHLSASSSAEGYLNNPVNAFRLIKRLRSDWVAYEQNVAGATSQTSYLEAMTRHRHNLSFPTEGDFEGSALALMRLQQTYQWDTVELASGTFDGVKYGSAMSWQDCFVLGQQLYTAREYNFTVPWLQQSMRLLAKQKYVSEPASLDFMEVVVAYHQEMGDYENALGLVNYILEKDSHQRPHLYDTKALLEELLRDGIKRGLIHETRRGAGDYHSSLEFRMYEEVCRGELRPMPSTQRDLRCKYSANLMIQPYKLEELNLDPYIVQVHEVINAEDMKIFRELAAPLMQRSQVYTTTPSVESSAAYRTSMSAYLEYNGHPVTQRLKQHVEAVTGLDKNFGEPLQIANYGIGGHFEPHLDSFPEHHQYADDDKGGNRIATGIFYLSELQAGGGTAFPFLQLLVKPEPGSLLLWYNLHRSGEQDYRTMHAGCPVLQGSKWIANVWIREGDQQEHRPCGLQPDFEISLPFKDFN